MIRVAAAIDDKRGLATGQGIPWDLPADVEHEKQETKGGNMLMGYNTYLEFAEAPPDRRWYVLTDGTEPLREGFEPVTDLGAFMQNPPENLWLFGGAGLFAQTLKYADELHLTHVRGDFDCTKFFPEYEEDFELVSQSPPQEQSGLTFFYAIYKRK